MPKNKKGSLQDLKYEVKFLPQQEKYIKEAKSFIERESEGELTLTYHVEVNEEVNMEDLGKTCGILIDYHELLQVHFETNGDELRKIFETNNADFQLNYFEGIGGQGKQIEEEITKISKQLVADIEIEKSPLFRVALIKLKDQMYRLLLVGHRFICDPESLRILAEDLYRIYRQINRHLPVTTDTEKILYSKIVANKNDQISQNDSPKKFVSEISPILPINKEEMWNRNLLKVLISPDFSTTDVVIQFKKFDLQVDELFTFAVLRSLRKIARKDVITFDIANSYRKVERNLEKVIGPLQFIDGFTFKFNQNETFYSEMIRLKNKVRQLPDSMEHTIDNQILLNFEYFFEQPWLGGDTWRPIGFVLSKLMKNTEYAIEILPKLGDDRIQIEIIYKDVPQLQEFIQSLSVTLIKEFEEVIIYCEKYNKNKLFWLDEFNNYESSLILQPDFYRTQMENKISLNWRFEDSLNNQLKNLALTNNTTLEILYLAVFKLLLSKHAERTDLTVISLNSLNNHYPIRTVLSNKMSFIEYLKDIQMKINSMVGREDAIEILKDKFTTDTGYFITDIGYLYCEQENQILRMEILEKDLNDNLNFILVVHPEGLQISYKSELFAKETIQVIFERFENILRSIVQDDKQLLEKIDILSETEKYLLDKKVDIEDLDQNFDF